MKTIELTFATIALIAYGQGRQLEANLEDQILAQVKEGGLADLVDNAEDCDADKLGLSSESNYVAAAEP